MWLHNCCSSRARSVHISKKVAFLILKFSQLLIIPGLQNDPFPQTHTGFPSPETALHCVKLRQEPLLYYQSGSVLLFFLISVWLPLPLKLLLLLEELLLPLNHKLGGVAGEG